MGRVRVAFGLLVVVVGTAWLLGGPDAVRSGGRWTLVLLPYVLLGLGLLLLLRAAVPRGLLAAPLALILVGALWAAYAAGWLGGAGRFWPGLIVLLGAAIALGGVPVATGTGNDGPLRHYRSVVLPLRPELVTEPGTGLRRITVASYLGDVRLRLADVPFQSETVLDTTVEVLELDVTLLFGSVAIELDHRCAVVKGDVTNALAVHFADQVRVYATTDIYADEARTELPRRIQLNVIGVGGTVAIRSR
ncbi:hypothetical protein [Streptomyces shenzhenensis]|uniref:Uncharacterized protein n=1 Tax=Streptomyces shenzhenensis TaxID=943815 RepID=A0A3M0INB9_9ACTN|nr:hypothetical protein [Streptomyces shenzhenensis]RMB87819.1 hypothetical protein CTZ28_02385 [Streptomyces shenzhenensis]